MYWRARWLSFRRTGMLWIGRGLGRTGFGCFKGEGLVSGGARSKTGELLLLVLFLVLVGVLDPGIGFWGVTFGWFVTWFAGPLPRIETYGGLPCSTCT